jgi:hypothetical protein
MSQAENEHVTIRSDDQSLMQKSKTMITLKYDISISGNNNALSMVATYAFSEL